MIRLWFRIILSAVIMVLLQTLVLNNIHIFGFVSPFIYIYVIMKLPFDVTRSGIIFVSFLIGLVVDIFSNTLGLHAAACTFMGFMRMPLLERLFFLKEFPERSIPSFNLFGYDKFIRYTLLLVAIHHVTLFLIESFSLFQPLLMIIRMVTSIMLTSLIILIIEAFNPGKKKSV
ncbi:MAG: rod shape-determining protein MreD [Tannerella sp.]|nr:rod shape-determining protein MreD [Tannerella sp.]